MEAEVFGALHDLHALWLGHEGDAELHRFILSFRADCTEAHWLRGPARSCSACDDPEGLWATERDVGVEAELLTRDEPEARKAPRQLLEGELGLELPERRAETEVDTFAECEVLRRVWPLEIEPLRIVEDLRVATRGGEPQVELRARGELDAAEGRRPGRHAPPDRYRRVVAQRFLDRGRDQRWLRHQALPARRVLEQTSHGVSDQVV